ncbi:MAG: hypothetical protein JWO62_3807 [Acidimicrobiaceae bacterium]|nr:hypothetical protein [Acidimicrobiaceae bacterium]
MSDFEFPSASETKPKRGANMAAASRPSPSSMPQAKLPQQAIQEVTEQATTEEGAAEPTKPKYDPDELSRVFDEVMFSGEYSEEVSIRGKLKIRLRTRTAEEIEQISMIIDSTTAQLVATLSEKRSILNLQYALETYGGKDLRLLSTEDRAKAVKRLPGPIVGALLKALNDFDAKVYAACQDGEENF